MAQARSVSVFLRANVTGFVSGMRSAQTQVGRLNQQVQQTTRNIGNSMRQSGMATGRLGQQMMQTAQRARTGMQQVGSGAARMGQQVQRAGQTMVGGMQRAGGAVGGLGRVMQQAAGRVGSGMRSASNSVGNFVGRVRALPGQVGGAFQGAGRAVSRFEGIVRNSTGRQAEAFSRLGRTMTVAAVGLVAGFVLTAREAMKFDSQMSAVKSVAGATSTQLQQLRQAALDMGKSTAYSATQAAVAEEELAKAGVSAADTIGGGLKGALNLAAAGTMDVGEAAEIAATAMTQFGLSGKDVPHIADLLAAGANKAQGSVHDLGYALKMGGLVGHQFGLTVDQTTGTLAAFASAGLIGRDSGTSFKTMLLHLANPTAKTRDLMHELGINVYDAQGKFIGITALAEQLRTKLAGLTEAQRNQALAQIFGTDAIRGANVLYRQGAAGIQNWINKVNDSGNASRTAASKMDNLHGDLMKLKGAFTTALIGTGEGAQSPLRGIVQLLTGVVNAFNSLPGPAKSAAFWIAGLTGAALLGAKALVFMVTTVKDAGVALAALGVTGERVGAGMGAMRTGLASTASFLGGPWGAAIGLGIAALSIWLLKKKDSTKADEQFTSALRDTAGAMNDQTRAAAANKLEQDGILKQAQQMGLNLQQVTDAVLGNKDAYAQVMQQIDAYTASQKKNYDQTGKVTKGSIQAALGAKDLKKAIGEQAQSLQNSAAAAKRETNATKSGTGAQSLAQAAAEQHAKAESALSQAMTDATKTADDLKKALDALSKANLDADEAAINQRKAASDAAKAAEDRAKFTDKERQSLIDLAKADQERLTTMKADGATADQLTAKQRSLANQFVRIAVAMGNSRSAAIKLAERYGLISKASDLTRVPIEEYIARVNRAATAEKNHAAKTGSAKNAQSRYTGAIKGALPVLYALAGSNKSAKAQVDALAKSVGGATNATNISHGAFLKMADAMGIGKKKAEDLWAALQRIKSRHVSVGVDGEGSWRILKGPGGVNAAEPGHGQAAGGEVPKHWSLGSGGETADDVPIMASVGEHMLTAREVRAAGGHGAVYRLRQSILRGELRGYATGGAISLTGGGRPAADVTQPITNGINHMVEVMAAAMAAQWKKYVGQGGPVVAAARAMIGLPYSWGGGGLGGPSYGIGRGAGTYGFDCSGLTEYAWGKGRGIDIGGVTDSQWANSTPISGPRPGALAFPSGPSVHVMLGSNKPGYVIQAPHTGAFVEEVPRSASMWRWPNAGYATGGAVSRLGDDYTHGRITRQEAELARRLGVAGDPGGRVQPEQHTAQIAKGGGTVRVWAEPETGGEAYIPLAASKRQRSKVILAQVARQFGMTVTGMADGGVSYFADGTDNTDDHLDLSTILGDWNDLNQPASLSDVTSAKKNRATQSSQLAAAKRALKKAEQSRADRIRSATRQLQRAYASHGAGRSSRIAAAKDALAKAKRTDAITNAEARLKKERQDLADATKKLTDTERRYKLGQQSPTTKLGSALAGSIKNTGAFISNLTKLADRGFGVLAKELLAMGGPDAEKIAADAVKLSDSKLNKLTGQINTAKQQQDTLANLPNIITARGALKTGTVKTWQDLLKATGIAPDDLAKAVRLMKDEFLKKPYGKTIWAQMIADGYATGGRITGPAGVDRVAIRATAGEYMVRASAANRRAALLEAINSGASDAVLRRLIPAAPRAAVASGGDGAAAPLVGALNLNHVPGYSTPQDVIRAIRHVELKTRYHRRRP